MNLEVVKMSKLGRLFAAISLAVLSLGMAPEPRVAADPGWEQGPLTEQTFALAADPTDERVVYAAGASGLWKTTDSGANWSLVSPEKVGSALAIDPKNPSVIYANGNTSRGGGGIYRSADGGKNWSIVRSGENPATIATDPVNSGIVYAGLTISNNYEILKSMDGGSSWNRLLRPAFSQSPGIGWVGALALAPSQSGIVYAGLGGYHSGDVKRSDDGGNVWRSIGSSGRLAPLMAPSAIAVDPQSPDVVYAGWALMGYKKLFRSRDGGATWEDLSTNLPTGGGSISSLLVDPTETDTLYAGIPGTAGGAKDGPVGGVFVSYDSGSSWSEIGRAGADKGRIVLAPKARRLYAAGMIGVWSYRMGFRVDSKFQDYYDAYDGLRVLGAAIGRPLTVNGYPGQYFEKGRLEDHDGEVADANWKLMFGLLVDELQAAKAGLPVGGEASSVTYADLYALSLPAARLAPPAGFQGGTALKDDGSAFVPYHHELKAEAGHDVPQGFWDYINRDDLFPGGWLHDIGLPMTEAVWAKVDKGDLTGRDVLIQAFQRAVLTYDPANPADWQVERANVGTDYLRVFAQK